MSSLKRFLSGLLLFAFVSLCFAEQKSEITFSPNVFYETPSYLSVDWSDLGRDQLVQIKPMVESDVEKLQRNGDILIKMNEELQKDLHKQQALIYGSLGVCAGFVVAVVFCSLVN